MKSVFSLFFASGVVAACYPLPDKVVLSGVVLDAPYGDGEPLPDAQVVVRDATLEVCGETSTNDDGLFSLDVAAGQDMYVQVGAEGYSTHLFAGSSGFFDLDFNDGTLWSRPQADAEAIVADFGDCAAGGEGGVIEGEVRLYMGGIPAQDLIVVETATVTAYDWNGDALPTCYLDEDGQPAPDGEMTNATGRFGIFDVPAGPITIEATYYIDGTDEVGQYWYYRVLMVEGAVAPFYPLLVEVVG